MKSKPSLKTRLQEGHRLTGGWAALASPLAAEIMASAGYDTVMIDMEHGPTGLTEAICLIQAITCQGAAPLIRVESNSQTCIKRVLDIGPAGIMVPNIQNAAQAREVVRNCRYGPAGNRGAAPGFMRATGYAGLKRDDPKLDGYPAFMREQFLLIIQVESAEAVEQIEDIVTVEGIDMILIGPADLSASLGKLGDFAAARFKDAFARIEKVTLGAGKFLGTIPFPGWSASRLYQQGHQLVIGGADGLLLASAADHDRAELDAARREDQSATGSS